MKFFVLIPLLFIAFQLNGQTVQETALAIEKVRKTKQVDKLKEAHPDWNIKVMKIEIDSEQLDPRMDALSKGDTLVIKNEASSTLYKLLYLNSTEEMRVTYIFLSGDAMTMGEINLLRESILTEYDQGASFDELAAKHTMDGNQERGDLGWTATDKLVPEFVKGVKARDVGEAFTLDIPLRNWYYVILKTYDERTMKNLRLLKITCPE